ncbi:DNA-directed RNA polymerase subunit K [Candidatus Pacearchaeota archaeon]|nr:MAG: DNA-directed RNA polymerase subunit K [Candidatus Pacearchaeota archaeon]RLJ02306.1 MAG: DNA-directed RNA polymerase subunit K [Candidatus Aenigmarchaeota archaeon]
MELTRFEMARIIGARALQLSYGAPPLVKAKGKPVEIAELEFKKGVLPIVVVRE